MASQLNHPTFQDAEKAREWLESKLWPEGPVCPHCGCVGCAYKVVSKSARPGVYVCKGCAKQFTVTVGTIFERSHIPLHKWLQATFLICASKKGMSAHQLHRILGITYKSAWFMCHRIREAMKADTSEPMGGTGKIVEADETYFGWNDEGPQKGKRGNKAGPAGKRAVVSLVERGGQVRTFHVKHASSASIEELLLRNVDRASVLHTDESRFYVKPGAKFAAHEAVKHSAGEYARGDVHSNTVENYFSIFKRGMIGVYQHCDEKHLQRYVTEFDFRYSNRAGLGVDDATRTVKALKGAVGKRLTYRRTNERTASTEG